MGKCRIFCAGEFREKPLAVEPGDCVIAADGGLRHVQALGIKPDIVLGDFDSLGYIPENAAVYPAEKDDTDAMLAVRRGLSLGFREFILYGGMEGKRPDHTVANLQILAFLAEQGAWGYLVGLHHIATVIRQERLQFPAGAQGICSVFCLGPDAKGVTLRGLKYPLENATLTASFPLGVSNRFLGEAATVQTAENSLLVLWEKENGYPARHSL